MLQLCQGGTGSTRAVLGGHRVELGGSWGLLGVLEALGGGQLESLGTAGLCWAGSGARGEGRAALGGGRGCAGGTWGAVGGSTAPP